MTLYEATIDRTGCSYVRCYVWAISLTDAVEMADAAFKERYKDWDGSGLGMVILMTGTDPPFTTIPDDEGWLKRE